MPHLPPVSAPEPSAMPIELRSFIDTLSEPRIVIDRQFRILYANAAYREHYAQGADVVGYRCHQVSHHSDVPCDQAGEVCPLRRCLETGQREKVLHIHHSPHGEEHVDVELSPILDAQGDAVAFVERIQPVPLARAQVSSQGLVGRSEAFRTMLDLVFRVARSETSVLLLGESGTGKELVAKAIHEASPRKKGPFVPVDCTGLTETLFESELFGYEKGAFTGAMARKTGLVEAASGGVLFLDEIGDMPLPQQVKLLRLLETQSYRRVGSVDPLRADFRLIAATHRDLKAMVRAGHFREDLYYRISAFPIPLPPLRARPDDIALLVETMLRRLAPASAYSLDGAALDCLSHWSWPGNVRELRNVLERAILLCDGGIIRLGDLPPELLSGGAAPGVSGFAEVGHPAVSVHGQPRWSAPGLPARPIGSGGAAAYARSLALPASLPDRAVSLRDLEQGYIRELAASSGSRKALAQALGISERTLYRRLRELTPPAPDEEPSA